MSKDDDFHIPPENIHFYEPSSEERSIMEEWIVKNHLPTNFTFNPRFSMRVVTVTTDCSGRTYMHVDDLEKRRVEVGRWLDYHRRNDITDEMLLKLAPEYVPVWPPRYMSIPSVSWDDFDPLPRTPLTELLKSYPESKFFDSSEHPSPDSLSQFKHKRGWPITGISITRDGPKKEIE